MMKIDELTKKLQEKKIKQDEVKAKFKAKDKVKKLTLTERIERIEELLNINEGSDE